MITNYDGLVNCINDDFEFLYDTKYLELIKVPSDSKWLNTHGNGDIMIYNKNITFFLIMNRLMRIYIFIKIGKWRISLYNE